ncbi:MAG TPA: phosphoribosylanthranilate isomerase [Steroidobacteraceae bacterium]|nr:phosphoribosylanthranilate isomerase [Steroidobacteraceae bacterium]
MATAVKICGITRVADALVAAHAGAHAIGMIFYPGSPRRVSHEVARQVVDALPAFVTPVALFVDSNAAEVERVIRDVKPQLLQFHGDETPEFCAGFGLPYIKATRVRQGTDLLQYARHYPTAKGLLLDAFVDGSHGGTGSTFDWALIPDQLPLPLILAGGLHQDNVADAIRRVRPWAVDVSSGVEATKGIKDAARIAAFIRGVRNADV